MTIAERLIVSLLAASGVAYLVTPYAISIANRFEFFDRPLGYKAHTGPTPYLGGAAVMAGFIAAVLLTAGDWRRTLPLVGGVAVLWAVGTADDRHNISPGLRVAVEVLLAALVWDAGLGWHLHLGSAVDLAMTAIWLVGVINAFNLFDNMDGAAGTMALAVSAGAAILGVVRHDGWLAVGAASLGGACLGFLPRNLSLPARIFLGDGGSMPIGFVAAVLVMVAAGTSTAAWESLPVALLLVGLPALDTTLVIVSRRRRGVPVLSGGKDHLTHRTRRLVPSTRAVALGLGTVQAVVSIVAVLAAEGGSSFVAVAAIAYTLAALCAIAWLESQGVSEQSAAAQTEPPGEAGSRGLLAPVPATKAARGAPSARSTAPRRRTSLLVGPVLLVFLGLGAGISPFFFAFYDATLWLPIGLALVALCAVGVIARPVVPGAPAALALVGLFGLGVWMLCSAAWTESVENAVVKGNRWLVYGALLTLLVVLVRTQRRAATALAAAGAGVGVVALSVLARLLGHDPGSLFLGGRLNEPLGYINGEGCLFAMGLWLCMACVESRRAVLAAPAAAGATLMACLALLSQSRGTAIGMLVALAATLALLPGRTRRAYALAVIAAALALAAPSLLHVYRAAAGGIVPEAAAHAAGRAALIASLAGGFVWGVLVAAWEAMGSQGLTPARARTTASWAMALPVVGLLALGLGSAHSIEQEARAQWHAFTHVGETPAMASAPASGAHAAVLPRHAARRAAPAPTSADSRSRLLSGAGNRYDYWRIAWKLWTEHPLAGVGAGGYTRYYYQRRATTEDIDQPHSLELQVLSELGVGGGLLLVCFLTAVAWGILRTGRVARSSRLARSTAVAAVGSFAAWLVQASVDWMHLLPGLTAIALMGAAALVWPRPQEQSASARRRAGVLATCALLATIAVAGASLSRQAIAQLYASRAEHELASNPAAAAADADRALGIDSDAVPTYYVKAAALARYDQAGAAQATLRQALGLEPHNFVTWALLGDILVRQGHLGQARRDYGEAHLLNPRNATLSALAADPAAALR